MKTKKIIALLSGVIFYFLLRGIIFSYDNKITHPTFNEYILKFFEANSQKYFPQEVEVDISGDNNTYSGTAVTNSGFLEISYGESEVEYTSAKWIEHGGFSADQPELAASVRHFYDPVGLNGGKKHLTNRGTYWEGVYSNPETDAIEWAIGDTPKGSSNWWSLERGKKFLKYAYELADESIKNSNIAKAFRSLGEVLHNTCDMGCPPHTRNDSHAAPIGYTGGYLLGSPDAYEELFDPTWISSLMGGNTDPNLKTYFDNAISIRAINEKLAEFTNVNFFTGQTINGVSNKLISPINEDGYYSSPLLQEMEYDEAKMIYFKTFPSGNRIKMAKDKGYFGRTYPYIDRDCVKSQATELIPNIIYAGSNVMRLFIPNLKVVLKSVDLDGRVKGTVKHTPSFEYDTEFYYSGNIDIYKSNSSEKIGFIDCENGDFEKTIAGIQSNDEIYGVLYLAGIKIRSNYYKVAEIEYKFTRAKINLHVKGFNTRTTADSSYEDPYYEFYETYAPEQIGSLTDSIFTSSWNYTRTDDFPTAGTLVTWTGSIQITFSKNFDRIISYTETNSENWPGWRTTNMGVTVNNIPLESEGDEWTPYTYLLSNDEATCNNVVSRNYQLVWYDGKSVTFSRNECDEESYIEIKLYE